MLALEVDAAQSLVQLDRSCTDCKSLSFFKPVSRNFAHLTLLGDSTPGHFDCLVQEYPVIKLEFCSSGPVRAILGQPSHVPTQCVFSRLKYHDVSTNLRLWHCGEVGYQVMKQMLLEVKCNAFFLNSMLYSDLSLGHHQLLMDSCAQAK